MTKSGIEWDRIVPCRPRHAVDLNGMPLDGLDRFLLSQVDDELSVSELCDLMPCPPEQTRERVDVLRGMSLLRLRTLSEPRPAGQLGWEPPTIARGQQERPIGGGASWERPTDGAGWDKPTTPRGVWEPPTNAYQRATVSTQPEEAVPPTIAEDIPMPEVTSPRSEADKGGESDAPEIAAELIAKLRDVDAMYASAREANHYVLLGIEAHASTKEVRKAYFGLSKRFHPDVYFRRYIGPYKAKLEFIFDALTRAHDTLRQEASRTEYDAAIGIARHAAPASVPEEAVSAGAPVPVPSVESEASRAQRMARQREQLMRELGHIGKTHGSLPRPPGASVVEQTSLRTWQTNRTQAERFERAGKWNEAAAHWAKVTEGLPDDADAHRRAAECFMEAGDARPAGRFATRAVALAPAGIEAREVLVRFFDAMGMSLNAQRERATIKKLKQER